MNILVLGGTGLISRQIVNTALSEGHEVTIFNRGTREVSFDKPVEVIVGDKRDYPEFLSKIEGRSFDVVIDMICYNPSDAKQTLNAFRGKCEQIIFTSSSAIYQRPYNSFPINEEDETYCTDESFTYGFEKANMEKFLLTQMGEDAPYITIIRPSLTFGVGGSNIGALRQNYNIIHRIKEGKPLLLFGDGTILWAFTFAKDLAKAYIMCCKNKNTYNDCYSVANSETVMWKDLYLAFGKILNKEVKFAYAPSAALNAVMPELFNHLEVEKKYCTVFSCNKFKKAVPQFNVTTSLEEGLKDIIAYWQSEGNIIDYAKDKLEDVLCEEYNSYIQNMSLKLKQLN